MSSHQVIITLHTVTNRYQDYYAYIITETLSCHYFITFILYLTMLSLQTRTTSLGLSVAAAGLTSVTTPRPRGPSPGSPPAPPSMWPKVRQQVSDFEGLNSVPPVPTNQSEKISCAKSRVNYILLHSLQATVPQETFPLQTESLTWVSRVRRMTSWLSGWPGPPRGETLTQEKVTSAFVLP